MFYFKFFFSNSIFSTKALTHKHTMCCILSSLDRLVVAWKLIVSFIFSDTVLRILHIPRCGWFFSVTKSRMIASRTIIRHSFFLFTYIIFFFPIYNFLNFIYVFFNFFPHFHRNTNEVKKKKKKKKHHRFLSTRYPLQSIPTFFHQFSSLFILRVFISHLIWILQTWVNCYTVNSLHLCGN